MVVSQILLELQRRMHLDLSTLGFGSDSTGGVRAEDPQGRSVGQYHRECQHLTCSSPSSGSHWFLLRMESPLHCICRCSTWVVPRPNPRPGARLLCQFLIRRAASVVLKEHLEIKREEDIMWLGMHFLAWPVIRGEWTWLFYEVSGDDHTVVATLTPLVHLSERIRWQII